MAADRHSGYVKQDTYHVVACAQSSWQSNSSPIIERECGHAHHSLETAVTCQRRLQRRRPDGMYLAAWRHASVRHTDNTPLSASEREQYYMVADSSETTTSH